MQCFENVYDDITAIISARNVCILAVYEHIEPTFWLYGHPEGVTLSAYCIRMTNLSVNLYNSDMFPLSTFSKYYR